MARETWVQSQVESYQRLKKWYLIPPCLTLSIIKYGSRVKWSNPGKGVAPSPTPWCSSYRKGSLRVTLDYSCQLYFTYILLKYLILMRYCINRVIGLMSRVFASSLGDQGSIPGQIIPKTLKMVLDATLLNTQHYEVRIKGKVEQSRERNSDLPYNSK